VTATRWRAGASRPRVGGWTPSGATYIRRPV